MTQISFNIYIYIYIIALVLLYAGMILCVCMKINALCCVYDNLNHRMGPGGVQERRLSYVVRTAYSTAVISSILYTVSTDPQCTVYVQYVLRYGKAYDVILTSNLYLFSRIFFIYLYSVCGTVCTYGIIPDMILQYRNRLQYDTEILLNIDETMTH